MSRIEQIKRLCVSMRVAQHELGVVLFGKNRLVHSHKRTRPTRTRKLRDCFCHALRHSFTYLTQPGGDLGQPEFLTRIQTRGVCIGKCWSRANSATGESCMQVAEPLIAERVAPAVLTIALQALLIYLLAA